MNKETSCLTKLVVPVVFCMGLVIGTLYEDMVC